MRSLTIGRSAWSESRQASTAAAEGTRRYERMDSALELFVSPRSVVMDKSDTVMRGSFKEY
jgi:hypothetical protein